MRHSIKNYLEMVTGCPVHMGKINYRKDGSFSRTITITGSIEEGDIDEEEIDSVADVLREIVLAGGIGTVYVYVLEETVQIKVSASGTSWVDVEEDFCEEVDWNDIDPEEEDTPEDKPSTTPSLDVEAILDGLHIGVNVTPLGVGYASDEKDLEKMKMFLAGALSMGKMFGM